MFKWATDANEEESKEVGVLIHFTPAANYLYVSTEGEITSELDEPVVVLYDKYENYIEVTGNYVILTLDSEKDIQSRVVDTYHLNCLSIPFIRIDVSQG